MPHRGKMRLLDVGSCFNPFLEFDEFLTVGIDIVPAVEVRITAMLVGEFTHVIVRPGSEVAGVF